MRRRVDRLGRAVLVTDKIWRLHQATLSRIDNEIARLIAEEQAALEALASIEPRLVLDRIATLTRRRLEMQAARIEALAAAREYGRRMKLTEKLHAEASEILRREENAEQSRQSQRPVSSSS
jgi:hypothetical protein